MKKEHGASYAKLLIITMVLFPFIHGCMRQSESNVAANKDNIRDTAEEPREETKTTQLDTVSDKPDPEPEVANLPKTQEKVTTPLEAIESEAAVKTEEGTSQNAKDVINIEKETIAPKPAQHLIKIDNITAYPWSFNPSAGQKMTISYKLSEPAKVQIAIYGPNSELINTILAGEQRDNKLHKEFWDGKDVAGQIVANEAYFFTIMAESDSGYGSYDPLVWSGGEKVNPGNIHFKPKENMFSYVLPKASRVLVRAGLDEGPMLNTLVNWLPRSPGLCTEYWRGKDRQGIQQYGLDPRTVVIVQAYALPENSIIAVGNNQRNYNDDFLSQGQSQTMKPTTKDRESWLEPTTSPHWYLPVCLDKDPVISLTFPELKTDKDIVPNEPVSLSGIRAIVRIDIPDIHSRRFIAGQQFELVVFVDNERLAEAEQGHLPFNWSWNLEEQKPGEHLLTFNLVTRQQHVGTASQRVTIIRPEQKK